MRRKAADRLVAGYLSDLDRALGSLSPDRRRQIVREIALHIEEGRADLDHEDPVAIQALLARVGDPRAIAAEAGAHGFSDVARSSDRFAPWLLLLGGFLFVVGWFAGLALLWASPTWRARDKLLGTLVLPGGLAFAFAFLFMPSETNCQGVSGPGPIAFSHCPMTGLVLPFPVGIVVLVVTVLAPILTAVRLERVRRRGEAATWSAQDW